MAKLALQDMISALLFAADKPLDIPTIRDCLPNNTAAEEIIHALQHIQQTYTPQQSLELVEVATGWRLQIKRQFAPLIHTLWQEKPSKYSQAFLETLAIIAYKQPITRSEIEYIRSVQTSSLIIRTLFEHNWIRVIGQRDVPGKPSLLATTKEFLDRFGLQSLNELPSLEQQHHAQLYQQTLPQ